jgi:hypothetical protein
VREERQTLQLFPRERARNGMAVESGRA